MFELNGVELKLNEIKEVHQDWCGTHLMAFIKLEGDKGVVKVKCGEEQFEHLNSVLRKYKQNHGG